MKKVIILCSALVFDFLTCSDVSAWEVDIDKVTAKNSAKAFEERLKALEDLGAETSGYTARWFVKGKWMGDRQCPGGCIRKGKVIGSLNAPDFYLGSFKDDLRKMENEIRAERRATAAGAVAIAGTVATGAAATAGAAVATSINQSEENNFSPRQQQVEAQQEQEERAQREAEPRRQQEFDDYMRERINQEAEEAQGQQQAEAHGHQIEGRNDTNVQNNEWVNREDSNVQARNYTRYLQNNHEAPYREASIEDQKKWLDEVALQRNLGNTDDVLQSGYNNNGVMGNQGNGFINPNNGGGQSLPGGAGPSLPGGN